MFIVTESKVIQYFLEKKQNAEKFELRINTLESKEKNFKKSVGFL